MKVRAIMESGTTRIVLAAEGEAEMRLLGVLGSDLAASVAVKHEGHPSYNKVVSIEVTLQPAPPVGGVA